MTRTSYKNIIPFVMISIVIHLFIYTLMDKHLNKFKFIDLKKISQIQKKRVIKIKSRKKIRTVGKKDGKKDIFTVPGTQKTSPLNQKKKRLKLTDLSNTLDQSIVNQKSVNYQKSETKLYKIFKNLQAQKIKQIKKRLLQEQIIKSLSMSYTNKNLLRNKGLNANIETPKGVSVDELNKLELVFFGFYKRVYRNIMNSMITNLNDILRKRPYVLRTIESSSHSLQARVTYDYLGNIVAIKIYESSRDDHVHQLFENILTDMNSLNNPPKQLINKNKEFSINYQLKIN